MPRSHGSMRSDDTGRRLTGSCTYRIAVARWRRRIACAGLCTVIVLSGCRGDRGVSLEPPPIVEADSTVARAEDDSGTATTDAPVFSHEPAAPIVENPETEATGNVSIGHCDVKAADNLCIDFTGSSWTTEEANGECSRAPGSSFRPESCPVEQRIGTCVIHPNGDESLEMVHSFYEPMDTVLAEAICPGKFELE